MTNIEKILAECDMLHGLLSDPHPGLATWHEFVNRRIEAIVRAYYGEKGLDAVKAVAAKEFADTKEGE